MQRSLVLEATENADGLKQSRMFKAEAETLDLLYSNPSVDPAAALAKPLEEF